MVSPSIRLPPQTDGDWSVTLAMGFLCVLVLECTVGLSCGSRCLLYFRRTCYVRLVPHPAAGAGLLLSLACGKMRTRQHPRGRRWLPSRTLTTINVRLRGDPCRADARAPGLHCCWHTQRHTGHWTLEPPQTLHKLHDELRTVFMLH